MAPTYSFSKHRLRSHQYGDTRGTNYLAVIILAVVGVLVIGVCVLRRILCKRRPAPTSAVKRTNPQQRWALSRLELAVIQQPYQEWLRLQRSNKGIPVPASWTRDVCAICLAAIEDQDIVRILRCTHIYHARCLQKWYLQKKQFCPLCRVSFIS